MRKTLSFYDVLILSISALLIISLGYGWHEMHRAINFNHPDTITLNYAALPYYTLRTGMRLLIGLVFSLIFAIIGGALSAKFAPIRHVMLPFVNFMESVPLVGFLTFSTVYFLHIFPHSVMGLECAAIFGVFTGQAWNMMLAVYQSLRIVPDELQEAARMFGYNNWQKFWRLELPYTTPALLWNTMVSQSSAWFALVASEAIPVNTNTVTLPGVGSYIAVALDKGNLHAIIASILALVASVIILDQLLFRPLVKLVARYKYEDLDSVDGNTSWFYNCVTNSLLCYYVGIVIGYIRTFFLYTIVGWWQTLHLNYLVIGFNYIKGLLSRIWYVAVAVAIVYYGHQLWVYFPKHDIHLLPTMMELTALRVLVAMILSILIFVPIGVWIGLNPKIVRFLQPIIQVLAALPSNIFYPLCAIYLIAFHQNLNFWSIVLIMLGTQWYILFNVIAGVTAIPNQALEVSKAFNVKGIMWWKQFMIPAIFPYIVTGIISAAGGAWNATITSEIIQWGKYTATANGLGAYIANASNNSQNAANALGCTAMCFMVGICIIFIWQPLYNLAENKFKFN